MCDRSTGNDTKISTETPMALLLNEPHEKKNKNKNKTETIRQKPVSSSIKIAFKSRKKELKKKIITTTMPMTTAPTPLL